MLSAIIIRFNRRKRVPLKGKFDATGKEPWDLCPETEIKRQEKGIGKNTIAGKGVGEFSQKKETPGVLRARSSPYVCHGGILGTWMGSEPGL